MQFDGAPAGAAKIVSWNVAGMRASMKKGLQRYIDAEDADIVCLQETKINDSPAFLFQAYPHQYWSHCKTKKGYSGTAVLSKIKPLSVRYTIGDDSVDKEGRFIILEFDGKSKSSPCAYWYLVACYIVNAGQKLERLQLKRDHYIKLQAFLADLQSKKPVVWTGDLNVAHKEIDLAKPKTSVKFAGFTPEEREDFSRVLEQLDMVDVYRHKHPEKTGAYTYYSFRHNSRANGWGWRIDYFVASRSLTDRILETGIRDQVYGASDHVPIYLILNGVGSA